jgi:hypothetical protein
LIKRRKATASSSASPRGLADAVERSLEEIGVVHARQLDRILEGEEDAELRALLGLEREQILPLEGDRAGGDL